MPAPTVKFILKSRLEKIVGLVLVAETVKLHDPHSEGRACKSSRFISKALFPLLFRRPEAIFHRHLPKRRIIGVFSRTISRFPLVPLQLILTRATMRSYHCKAPACLLICNSKQHSEEESKVPRPIKFPGRFHEIVGIRNV